MKRHILPALVTMTFLISLLTLAWSQGQDKSPQNAGFPDLVPGLKATKGCLGVETARTSGGKNVIFAWFENKKAALNWYYSDVHQSVMKMFGNDKPRKPLEQVADDSGPILCIASITPSDKPLPGLPVPISQIAIELYQPVPGGAFVGGRFAPGTVKVQNLIDYTAQVGK